MFTKYARTVAIEGETDDGRALHHICTTSDGYPAEREALLATSSTGGIRDVVVLSGDVHVSLALEVASDGTPGGQVGPTQPRGLIPVRLDGMEEAAVALEAFGDRRPGVLVERVQARPDPSRDGEVFLPLDPSRRAGQSAGGDDTLAAICDVC